MVVSRQLERQLARLQGKRGQEEASRWEMGSRCLWGGEEASR